MYKSKEVVVNTQSVEVNRVAGDPIPIARKFISKHPENVIVDSNGYIESSCRFRLVEEIKEGDKRVSYVHYKRFEKPQGLNLIGSETVNLISGPDIYRHQLSYAGGFTSEGAERRGEVDKVLREFWVSGNNSLVTNKNVNLCIVTFSNSWYLDQVSTGLNGNYEGSLRVRNSGKELYNLLFSGKNIKNPQLNGR